MPRPGGGSGDAQCGGALGRPRSKYARALLLPAWPRGMWLAMGGGVSHALRGQRAWPSGPTQTICRSRLRSSPVPWPSGTWRRAGGKREGSRVVVYRVPAHPSPRPPRAPGTTTCRCGRLWHCGGPASAAPPPRGGSPPACCRRQRRHCRGSAGGKVRRRTRRGHSSPGARFRATARGGGVCHAPAARPGLLEGLDDAARVVHLLGAGREHRVGRVDGARVNEALAVEAQVAALRITRPLVGSARCSAGLPRNRFRTTAWPSHLLARAREAVVVVNVQVHAVDHHWSGSGVKGGLGAAAGWTHPFPRLWRRGQWSAART